MRRGERSALIFAVLAAALVSAMVVFWPVDRAQLLDATAPGTVEGAGAGVPGGAAVGTELGAGTQTAVRPRQVNISGSEVDNPVVTIEMDSGAKIEIELYPDVAPNTVNNFVSLVRKGFYDGLIFHRIVPGFVIQGGDPDGRGTGGPGYSIRGEFAANGFPNDLSHTRGVVSMARAQHPDSAGSQFFIVVDDATFLDGQYAAFGKVVSGMEEVDRIVALPRDQMDRPLDPPVMVKVTVDEQGAEYPEPEKITR